MPSPVSASTTAPSVQSHEPSDSDAAQGAQDAPNGTAGEDASDSPAGPAASGQAAEGSDAIREGKEKAKVVMVASGVEVGAASGQKTSPGRATSPSTTGDGANGTSPSRKRSRSGSRLPSQPPAPGSSSQSQHELTQHLINEYSTRDMLHAAAMNQQADNVRQLMNEKLSEVEYYKQLRQQRQIDPGSVFGHGFDGYGNGFTEAKPARLQYPAARKRLGNRRSKSLQVTRKDITKQAEQYEELVPVRLDIEYDKIKLRDTFTWNLHDRVVTPELFSENMVEDFKLPQETSLHVMRQINHEIHEQLQDFYPHIFIKEDPLDPHLPYDAYKNDEMRILIKLNITIGAHTLVDQFEWDINDPMNSPEEFARSMTTELSLSGEFATAIAHSIREQCQMFTKSLYITGHPFDGRPVEDADVRDSFLLSPLGSVFRPVQAAKDFAPVLYELSEADLERAELSIMREQRRQKRSVNRRGGPALPDLKDRQRTVRTMVVSSVLPGAAERIEESRLYKPSRSSGRGRRTIGRGDGIDDSDESESEESAPESPAPSQIMMGGTARTRGMRGAAIAATGAMRANLGRSQTPEVSMLQHHHETRTSRRFGHEREESVVAEPTTFMVKLRISRDKLRRWAQAQNTPRAAEYRQNSISMPSQAATPLRATPARSSMPPPPSPATQQRSTPAADGTPTSNGQREWKYFPDGRAEATFPQPPAHETPPPPQWLKDAVIALKAKYPQDNFDATMRWSAVDTRTQSPARMDSLPQGAPIPSHIKFFYLPRIRCHDCPGKLYTAGPGLTVENFEVHLKNRLHLEAVKKRRAASGGLP